MRGLVTLLAVVTLIGCMHRTSSPLRSVRQRFAAVFPEVLPVVVLLELLALPLLLTMLQYSLRSIETYTYLTGMLQHPASKLLLLGLLWAFFHHLCAGIRYLAIDLDCGVGLAQARASSRWVLLLSLGLTVLMGVWLW